MKAAGKKRKGVKAESEVASILNDKGIVTRRVLSSGAHRGAKGDLRIGVSGSNVDSRDTGTELLRAEVKNFAQFPAGFLEEFAVMKAPAPALILNALSQAEEVKVAIVRHPKGATAARLAKQPLYVVAMSLDDFANIVLELLEAKKCQSTRKKKL